MFTKICLFTILIGFAIGTLGQFIWVAFAPDKLFMHHWTIAGIGLSICLLGGICIIGKAILNY